jgi:sugar phosphate isomerase/epimerase
VFDEHLLPGRGTQPVAEVLAYLAAENWSGSIVAEVNTRKSKTEQERLELLIETVAFARAHAALPARPPRFARSRRALAALMPGKQS